mmetsp:Transcript_77236/g.139355  ORF Transcript_77236/g.139355 Transcript_77236/m.139355 type:complete len:596 (+) Transcript_77236:650-2437(+)
MASAKRGAVPAEASHSTSPRAVRARLQPSSQENWGSNCYMATMRCRDEGQTAGQGVRHGNYGVGAAPMADESCAFFHAGHTMHQMEGSSSASGLSDIQKVSSAPSLLLPGLKEPFPVSGVSRSQESAYHYHAHYDAGFAANSEASGAGGLGYSAAQWSQAQYQQQPQRQQMQQPPHHQGMRRCASGMVGMPEGSWQADEQVYQGPHLQHFQPQWQPVDEEPPVYDGRLGAPRGPVPPHCHSSSAHPESTCGFGGKKDFVLGGQELARPGNIPTPARSQALSSRAACEAGVQADRRSIDGHAAAAAAAAKVGKGRSRLQSIIRRTGAPGEDDEALTPPPLDSSRSRRAGGLKKLDYPLLGGPLCGERSLGEAPPSGCGPRAAMAQALSVAVAGEMHDLAKAWDLGAPGGERRLEEAVATSLRAISRRAEKSGVLKALRQPSSAAKAVASAAADVAAAERTEEAAALEERCARLEAELVASEDRLSKLDEIQVEVEEGLAAKRGGEPHGGLQDLLALLSEEVLGEGSISSLGEEFKGQLDQCLQRLGLVDLWFHQTFAQLEETRKELADREQAVTAQAFVHLPGAAPNAQRALARLA